MRCLQKESGHVSVRETPCTVPRQGCGGGGCSSTAPERCGVSSSGLVCLEQVGLTRVNGNSTTKLRSCSCTCTPRADSTPSSSPERRLLFQAPARSVIILVYWRGQSTCSLSLEHTRDGSRGLRLLGRHREALLNVAVLSWATSVLAWGR